MAGEIEYNLEKISLDTKNICEKFTDYNELILWAVEHKHFYEKSVQTKLLKLLSTQSMMTCSFCEKTFKHKFNFIRHIKSIHLKSIYFCDICFKSLTRQDKLAEHRRTHFVQNYTCELCQCTFKSQFNLESHIEKIHNQKHECVICNLNLASKKKLNQHLLAFHSLKSTYECSKCQRCFSTKYNRNRHEKSCQKKSSTITEVSFICKVFILF